MKLGRKVRCLSSLSTPVIWLLCVHSQLARLIISLLALDQARSTNKLMSSPWSREDFAAPYSKFAESVHCHGSHSFDKISEMSSHSMWRVGMARLCVWLLSPSLRLCIWVSGSHAQAWVIWDLMEPDWQLITSCKRHSRFWASLVCRALEIKIRSKVLVWGKQLLQAKLLDVWHAWAICRTLTLVTSLSSGISKKPSNRRFHWISRQYVCFSHWHRWHLWQVADLDMYKIIHMMQQDLWHLARTHIVNLVILFVQSQWRFNGFQVSYKLLWLAYSKSKSFL